VMLPPLFFFKALNFYHDINQISLQLTANVYNEIQP